MLSELFGASARTECGPNIKLLSLSSPIGIRTRTSALKGPRLKPSVPGTKNIAFHLTFATLLGLLLYAETLSYVLPFLYRLYVLASHRTYTALIQSKTFIVESNHKEHEL